MNRYFLFTLKVLNSSDWNTYQLIVHSLNGKVPDLNTLLDLAERRWKAQGVELQFLCYTEFKTKEDVSDLLGSLMASADVYELGKNDILKLKKRSNG